MSHHDVSLHMKALGVGLEATATEVRAAWKSAVKQNHPDIVGPKGHFKLLIVNAAYDALKEGVPKAMTQPRSAQQTSRPVHPAGTTIKSFRNIEISIPQSIQDRWRDGAHTRIKDNGMSPKPPGKIARLFGRKGDFRIHIPKTLRCHGVTIELIFSSETLDEGTNIFVLPTLRPKDGSVISTGEFKVVTIKFDNAGAVRMVRAPSFDSLLLPGITGQKVYVSNA